MSEPMGVTVRKIALVGNSPPRLCGIATFTRDLRDGLLAAFPGLSIDTYAMTDRNGLYDYPSEVVCSIRQDEIGDYAAAAHRINESGADVVCIQHEYGIFGGGAGAHLFKLLDRVSAPVVVTLHTVLEHPDPEQRAVIEALVRRAYKLVVMAEKGREILRAVHGVPADRIAVVPHGAPDRALSEGRAQKAAFGLEGRTVLLTFGLLSPNKGIATMIRAMPSIVSRHPDALYIVLGATHPHLVAQEGEAYRDGLKALARDLGVSEHVRFVDGFVEQGTLLEWLAAADIYVTPYLNEAQITSGTLSYAVALGKPVVSTPYWHAAELLAGGTGVLVPFADSEGFAGAINRLLGDSDALEQMRRKAWAAGRAMIWPEAARAYVGIFEAAIAARPARLARPRGAAKRPLRPAPPRLEAIERMTDACGIVQHGIFSVPDRNHGYCVDDNCRALMLMHRITGTDTERADRLAFTYAAFVQHAWNGALGRFRNFMGFDRNWLEREGSEDSFGRSLWSLGVTAATARRHDMRRWAAHLFDQVAPHARAPASPRTWAFSLIGADAMLDAHPANRPALALVKELGERLLAAFERTDRAGWRWFESVLAYDNARLPEALIRAGRRLGRTDMTEAGLASLAWLDEVQTNAEGQFRAVGTDSFGRAFTPPLPFDQQPLEAWATIDACLLAADVTGEARWEESAARANAWYLGANDLGVPIGQAADGGCFDGLMSDRVNLNQGAESVLAFQFACCAMGEWAQRAGRGGAMDESADAIAS